MCLTRSSSWQALAHASEVPSQEPDGCVSALISPDLETGQVGRVIDRDVHRFPSRVASVMARTRTQGAIARSGEAAQGLDIDVNQPPACRRACRFAGSTASSHDSRFRPSRASTAQTVSTTIPRFAAIAELVIHL